MLATLQPNVKKQSVFMMEYAPVELLEQFLESRGIRIYRYPESNLVDVSVDISNDIYTKILFLCAGFDNGYKKAKEANNS